MRRTSRYLRFRALQVIITPFGSFEGGDVEVEVEIWAGDWRRVESAVSRRRISQSHLSASLSGWPWLIFSTFSGVWNWLRRRLLVVLLGLVFLFD